MLGQCLRNGTNDVLVGVPYYASSDEFTEFLFSPTVQPAWWPHSFTKAVHNLAKLRATRSFVFCSTTHIYSFGTHVKCVLFKMKRYSCAFPLRNKLSAEDHSLALKLHGRAGSKKKNIFQEPKACVCNLQRKWKLCAQGLLLISPWMFVSLLCNNVILTYFAPLK